MIYARVAIVVVIRGEFDVKFIHPFFMVFRLLFPRTYPQVFVAVVSHGRHGSRGGWSRPMLSSRIRRYLIFRSILCDCKYGSFGSLLSSSAYSWSSLLVLRWANISCLVLLFVVWCVGRPFLLYLSAVTFWISLSVRAPFSFVNYFCCVKLHLFMVLLCILVGLLLVDGGVLWLVACTLLLFKVLGLDFLC